MLTQDAESAFRLEVADRYEQVVLKGASEAEEALRWLATRSPVPAPWWMGDVLMALAYARQGSPYPNLSPSDLRDYKPYEARLRKRREAAARWGWIPFRKSDPRHAEHRERFDRLMGAALDFVLLFDSLDDQLAPLLSSSLRTALEADADYRPRGEPTNALRTLVARLEGLRCLPLSGEAAGAVLVLKKILDHWSEKDSSPQDPTFDDGPRNGSLPFPND